MIKIKAIGLLNIDLFIINTMNNPRIAWLLPSAVFYWHPMLGELAKIFPQTTAFSAYKWLGYAQGYEDSFNVEVLGERKVVPIIKDSKSYGTNFSYLPLNIVNRLLKFKPSVIFSNSFGLWTLLALISKPLGRWKVVIAYEGSSPGVDYRNSPTRLAMRKTMVKAADACITNSHAGKDYLVELLQADKNRVFVQPYEVPDSNSMLAKHTLSNDKNLSLKRPIFIFVGKVTPRKGLHLLLNACAILAKQGCHDYTLQIVGDGPQVEELKDFCEKNNLTKSVQWVGRVDYSQIGEYFSSADVFVLPTLEDTWGMVVLEAMVLGKAILCSKWAGASELVTDGENGYRFDPYKPEQVAELMRQFINNPQIAIPMGEKSQQLMKNKYTPQAAAKSLAEVTSFVLGD